MQRTYPKPQSVDVVAHALVERVPGLGPVRRAGQEFPESRFTVEVVDGSLVITLPDDVDPDIIDDVIEQNIGKARPPTPSPKERVITALEKSNSVQDLRAALLDYFQSR